MTHYIGRFAPSPTGALHLGSLACLLASYVDAKAHRGSWFVRIEDIDPPREPPAAAEKILQVIDALKLKSDFPVLFQSTRSSAYQEALQSLIAQGLAYGCACSRKNIEQATLSMGLPKGVYPGTCRSGTKGKPVRAWRFRLPKGQIGFEDRLKGCFSQDVEREVGDFVLKRADGLWAYQLAVVVDDAFSGVTHVVRGEDLLDNTPRQIALQRSLGVKTPQYMHIPLVLNKEGQKLSKQNGATPVDSACIEKEVCAAWAHLGFEPFEFDRLEDFYRQAVKRWHQRFRIPL